MGFIREIKEIEKLLLQKLIDKAEVKIRSYSYLLVEELRDGGMGSVRFHLKEDNQTKRNFGSCVSEIKFKDKDGIDVILSLYLDTDGDVFELDVWKTNFSKVLNFENALK